MKLTRRHRRELEQVESDLQRALDYVRRPDIAVAHKRGPATTTLHYTRPDGATLYELAKDIGSNLTGLESGLVRVRRMLQEAG